MVALLAEMRRQRNGAVADAMRYRGARYGLNYGVSLPTVRSIARSQESDNAFARFLLRQDVRELRLAALHLAQPEQLEPEEMSDWEAVVTTSEIAEEIAFALLPKLPFFESLFHAWTSSGKPLLEYAALLGAVHSRPQRAAWLGTAAEVVRRNPDDRLTAQAAATLLAAYGELSAETRTEVFGHAAALGDSTAAELVRGELAWRLPEQGGL